MAESRNMTEREDANGPNESVTLLALYRYVQIVYELVPYFSSHDGWEWQSILSLGKGKCKTGTSVESYFNLVMLF